MNKNYEAFRNNVLYAVRASGLELGSIYYILKDIMSEIEKDYSNAIRQELETEEATRREVEAKEEAVSIGPEIGEETLDL